MEQLNVATKKNKKEDIHRISSELNKTASLVEALLNHSALPKKLQLQHVDQFAQFLYPGGGVRVGLPLMLEAGVSWRDIDGLISLHFRGNTIFNQFGALNPSSYIARSLSRYRSTGLRMEPCQRVVDELLDSAVASGVLDSDSNIGIMELTSLVLDCESKGKLPRSDVSAPQQEQLLASIEFHQCLVMVRVALSKMSVGFSTPATEARLDLAAIRVAMSGEWGKELEKELKAMVQRGEGSQSVKPMPILIMSKGGDATDLERRLSVFNSIEGSEFFSLEKKRASHPTGLSSSFDNKKYMRMSKADRCELGTMIALFSAQISGKHRECAALLGQNGGYTLPWLEETKLSDYEYEHDLAGRIRAMYSSTGFAKAVKGDFRTKGSNRGTHVEDDRITKEQYTGILRGMITSSGFAKAVKGDFRTKGDGKGTLEDDDRITKAQYLFLLDGKYGNTTAGYQNAEDGIFRVVGDGKGAEDYMTKAQYLFLSSSKVGRPNGVKNGEGKYGRANLGKWKGRGTSSSQKRSNDKNNTKNNTKNNKKRKDRPPVECLCGRSSCTVSFAVGSACKHFRHYYSGAHKNKKMRQNGLDCAVIVREKYPNHNYLQERKKSEK